MIESEKRPDIKPAWSLVEKLLQAVCAIILAVHIILLIKVWNILPSSMPTHFDFFGKPDGYGSKNTMLMLPIMSSGLYAMLTILERFPKIYNYSVDINELNAAFMYQTGREMMVVLKTVIVAIFAYIDFATVETARGAWNGLSPWFLIVSLVILFGSMIYYIVRMKRHKDNPHII
jgi:uncharacterized membrane protein